MNALRPKMMKEISQGVMKNVAKRPKKKPSKRPGDEIEFDNPVGNTPSSSSESSGEEDDEDFTSGGGLFEQEEWQSKKSSSKTAKEQRLQKQIDEEGGDSITYCGCFHRKTKASKLLAKEKVDKNDGTKTTMRFEMISDKSLSDVVVLEKYTQITMSTDKPDKCEPDPAKFPKNVDAEQSIEELELLAHISRIDKLLESSGNRYQRASADDKGLAANAQWKEVSKKKQELTDQLDSIQNQHKRKKAIKNMVLVKGVQQSRDMGKIRDSQKIVLKSSKQGHPVGIVWHFQSDRAIVSLVTDGGSAARFRNGKACAGIVAGMVLKSFSSKMTPQTVVTRTKVAALLAKNQAPDDNQPGDEADFLAAMLEMAGRPLSLSFEDEHFANDKTEAIREELKIDLRMLKTQTGCEVEPLKFAIPKSIGDLGLKLWPTPAGVTVCDIVKPGIMAGREYLREGIRPGLTLIAIAAADGMIRNLEDTAHLGIQSQMQMIRVLQRPILAIFDPTERSIEYQFDEERTCAKITSSDRKHIAARSKAGTGFSIFRALGLSLIEEDVSAWSHRRWRVRVMGIHEGGMVDRYNRQNGHEWITVGMTIASVRSACYEFTDLTDCRLEDISNHFHMAAPGREVAIGMDGGAPVVDGRSITIGFSITYRARTMLPNTKKLGFAI